MRKWICAVLLLIRLVPSGYAQNGYKGLYVDGFANILGNRQREDSLLQYAASNGFNTLTLYELQVVNEKYNLAYYNTSQVLADFIYRARQQYGIPHITAIGENTDFFEKLIHRYNQNHTSDLRFDGFNLEFEFWTPAQTREGSLYCQYYLKGAGLPCDNGGAYKFFCSQVPKIAKLAHDDGAKFEVYVGWIDSMQCVALKPYADRILLHAYVTDPRRAFAYTKSRLSYFGSTEHPVEVVTAFSAEDSFMKSWVMDSTEAAAFPHYLEEYNKQPECPWKDRSQILGYQWFDYSNMPYRMDSVKTYPEVPKRVPTIYYADRRVWFRNFSLNAELKIFDLYGREFLFNTFEDGAQGSVALPEGLTPGIYLVKMSSKNESIGSKFQVE